MKIELSEQILLKNIIKIVFHEKHLRVSELCPNNLTAV